MPGVRRIASSRACGCSAEPAQEARPRRRRRPRGAAPRPCPGGEARTDHRRADRARSAAPRLRVVVSVADAGLPVGDRHRPAPGRLVHPRPDLVPARRGPVRRVRLELLGDAGRGIARRDQRLDPEPQPPPPVAERAHGVRAGRGRRPDRGGDQLLRLPRSRPASAQAPGRGGASRARSACSTPPTGRSRFFFGELFASDRTGASPNLGVHAANDDAGRRDRPLAGGARRLRLPPLLPPRRRHGAAQASARSGALDAVAIADRSISSLVDAGGGLDRFLESHGVVLLADHGQTRGARRVRRAAGARRPAPVRRLDAVGAGRHPGSGGRVEPRSACCTGWPMLRRRATSPGASVALDGVDLAAFSRTATPWCSARGAELRFRRGGPVRDRRGTAWTVTGELGALGLEQDGDVVAAPGYPNALERVGLPAASASTRARSSARLQPATSSSTAVARTTSAAARTARCPPTTRSVPLITVGVDASRLPGEPSITDAYGLVQRHFGL